jgi:hypothetical protein
MRRTKQIGAPRTPGVAGLYAVPVLVELAADPSKAGMLDGRTTRVLAAPLSNGAGPLVYGLPLPGGFIESEDATRTDGSDLSYEDGVAFDADDITTVEEIAEILHVPRRWIIRKARRLPFVKQMSRKKYVCSRIRMRQWLASRLGPSNVV